MTLMAEIHEQPAALARSIEANVGLAERIASLRHRDVTHVVVAARGTSGNAARYAQYLWGWRNRISVGHAAPSLFTVFGRPPDLSGALVVGISQSGASPDLVAVLAEARRQGRPTLAITNDPESALAAVAEVVVDLAVGEERSVAATKTYTAELAAVMLCSFAFAGDDPDPLGALPDVASDTLARASEIAEPASVLAEASRVAVVGRGFHHATVHEWALKLQEVTYVLAQPYSAAEFLHGPVAVVEDGFPVLTVATSGHLVEPMLDLVTDLVGRGADVLVISDRPVGGARAVLPIPTCDEWLAPVPAAIAAQLFSHALAVAKGHDPDRPRGLRKVTYTL